MIKIYIQKNRKLRIRFKKNVSFLFILCVMCFNISLLLNRFYNVVFSDKGIGRLLYSAVSNPQYCSKRLTLYFHAHVLSVTLL